MGRFLAANAAMALVLAYLAEPLAWWLDHATWERAYWLLGQVAAGVGAYFGTLLLVGLRLDNLKLNTD